MMEGLFTVSNLLFVVAVAAILFFTWCLPQAAKAGDQINRMVNAAQYEHDRDGEP